MVAKDDLAGFNGSRPTIGYLPRKKSQPLSKPGLRYLELRPVDRGGVDVGKRRSVQIPAEVTQSVRFFRKGLRGRLTTLKPRLFREVRKCLVGSCLKQMMLARPKLRSLILQSAS